VGSTTLVLVEIEGGGNTGLGYTYGNEAIARGCPPHLVNLVQVHYHVRMGKSVLQSISLRSVWQ
jgi:hypothetical protein